MKPHLLRLLAVCWLTSRLSMAATFTITTIEDSGPGSLRQAILDANATPELDSIHFKIPGQAPYTIKPATALPRITAPVIIDGTTQPGFAGQPIIELDGSALINVNGLHFRAGNSTVRGLVINRFSRQSGLYYAIFLETGGSNVIEGNFIGADVSGTSGFVTSGFVTPGQRPSHGISIESASPDNQIGGTNAASRNVISGNEGAIFVRSARNKVQGNFIGTDVTGVSPLPNNSSGIYIERSNNATNNLIGGTDPLARNIISGNLGNGIVIGIPASGNLIQGNFIGVDATGTNAIGNKFYGVAISGTSSSNNTIGGNVPSTGNVISGNSRSGIGLHNATRNIIQGNFIGTDVSGRINLGNIENGIELMQLAPQFAGTLRDNIVGGSTPELGNVIAFNVRDGVSLQGGAGNAIRGNSIFANGDLAIDLGANGVTENDSGDSGANNPQNFPVLTSAMVGADSIAIQGSLNSKANSVFSLDFFANQSCSPSGHGEGEKFLGSTTVTTDANNDVNFNVTIPVSVPAGQFVTATATDGAGNTSEFSACLAVIAGDLPPRLSVAKSVSSDQLIFSWPTSVSGFVLETTEHLSPPIVWTAVTNPPVTAGDRNTVTLTLSGSQSRFYRIRKP